MTDGPRSPRRLKGGSVSQMLGELVRSPKFWLVAAPLGGVVTVVPEVAKAPVAVALGTLVARILIQAEARSGSRPRAPVPSTEQDRFVTFVGFRGERGPTRIKWRQVRCRVEDDLLKLVSYWRRRSPALVLDLRGAVLTEERASDRGDWNLKPGQARVMTISLADGSSLLLAVANRIAEDVQGALALLDRT